MGPHYFICAVSFVTIITSVGRNAERLVGVNREFVFIVETEAKHGAWPLRRMQWDGPISLLNIADAGLRAWRKMTDSEGKNRKGAPSARVVHRIYVAINGVIMYRRVIREREILYQAKNVWFVRLRD